MFNIYYIAHKKLIDLIFIFFNKTINQNVYGTRLDTKTKTRYFIKK